MCRLLTPLLSLALAVGCARGTAPPAPEPAAGAPVAPPSPAVERPERQTPPPDDTATAEPEGTAAGVRRLGRWSRSGVETSERLVLRETGALAEFWARIEAGDAPSVNFDEELVVAVAAGPRPGGSTIAVGRSVLQGDTLSIEVMETTPWPDCPGRDKLSRPVDVVAISAEGVRGGGSWNERRWEGAGRAINRRDAPKRQEVPACGGRVGAAQAVGLITVTSLLTCRSRGS